MRYAGRCGDVTYARWPMAASRSACGARQGSRATAWTVRMTAMRAASSFDRWDGSAARRA